MFIIPLLILALCIGGAAAWQSLAGGLPTADTDGGDVDISDVSKIPEDKYKSGCLVADYDEMAADIAGMAGKNIKMTGEVFEVRKGILLIDTKFDPDYGVYYGGTMIVDTEALEVDYSVGDEITVYGILKGEAEYYEGDYGKYLIPAMKAVYVEKL